MHREYVYLPRFFRIKNPDTQCIGITNPDERSHPLGAERQIPMNGVRRNGGEAR